MTARLRTFAYTTLAELFVAAVFVADRAVCVYLSVRNAVADEMARADEGWASALGDSETTFPVDWPHRNACPCEFCRSAAMGGGR